MVLVDIVAVHMLHESRLCVRTCVGTTDQQRLVDC